MRQNKVNGGLCPTFKASDNATHDKKPMSYMINHHERETTMRPLKTITQAAALAGLGLTACALFTGDIHALEAFALAVFFFWAHVYAHAEIDL
jgi:hypothetical protein